MLFMAWKHLCPFGVSWQEEKSSFINYKNTDNECLCAIQHLINLILNKIKHVAMIKGYHKIKDLNYTLTEDHKLFLIIPLLITI